MTSYLTVARDGAAEIEAKRSRFIAQVARAMHPPFGPTPAYRSSVTPPMETEGGWCRSARGPCTRSCPPARVAVVAGVVGPEDQLQAVDTQSPAQGRQVGRGPPPCRHP